MRRERGSWSDWLRRSWPYLLITIAAYAVFWTLESVGERCDNASVAIPYCVAGVGHGEATVPVYALLSGVVAMPLTTAAAGMIIGLRRGLDHGLLGSCFVLALILPISLWGASGSLDPTPTVAAVLSPLGAIYFLAHVVTALVSASIGSAMRDRRRGDSETGNPLRNA